eukprot:jgi/Ulvmu1/12041/UM083_0054.1
MNQVSAILTAFLLTEQRCTMVPSRTQIKPRVTHRIQTSLHDRPSFRDTRYQEIAAGTSNYPIFSRSRSSTPRLRRNVAGSIKYQRWLVHGAIHTVAWTRAVFEGQRGPVQPKDVIVFDSDSNYGRVLALDGVIQVTEFDEFSYQEMIVHLPLCGMARAPERVLIVGGGDGGVAREIAKHPSVKKIDMAEIDGMVPEVSKKFFPQLAAGFEDPRLNLQITDGVKWLEDCEEGTYDAIIVDSSDPVGPAEALFEEPFFRLIHRALAPGGVLSTQGESMWIHLDIIENVSKMCTAVFDGGAVNYAYTTIPTYPTGLIGFMVCQKAGGDTATGATEPHRQLPAGATKYYHSALHRAAFVLPQFVRQRIGPHLTAQGSG